LALVKEFAIEFEPTGRIQGLRRLLVSVLHDVSLDELNPVLIGMAD